MTVQLPNCRLGVRRAESPGLDAHGSPRPATPGELSELLPGKRAEQDTGQWQLALDPTLWPVRVGDRVVAHDGAEWVVIFTKYIPSPALEPGELDPGQDMDVAFIRVTGNQVTPLGTEPTDSTMVGRA